MALGDLNRDGRKELAVGAPGASPNDRTQAGSCFVVWGRNDLDMLDVLDLNIEDEYSKFSEIFGESEGDQFGGALVVSNCNSDIDRDLVVGAYLADPEEQNAAGGMYVFLGFQRVSFIDYSPVQGEHVSKEEEINVYFNADISTT